MHEPVLDDFSGLSQKLNHDKNAHVKQFTRSFDIICRHKSVNQLVQTYFISSILHEQN
jgi:hypothetical protein